MEVAAGFGLPARSSNGKDYIIKVLTLGDSGVGKTTFLHRYTEGVFVADFISTVGIDLREKLVTYKSKHDYVNNNNNNNAKKVNNNNNNNNKNGIVRHHPRPASRETPVRLQLWDTAGQERYRALTTAFFRYAMGFLLMFDLTQESSFLNIRNWLAKLEMHVYYHGPAIVLIGNKADLKKERVVTQDSAASLAENLGIKYFETSSLTNENMNEAIEHLLDIIMSHLEKRKAVLMGDAVGLGSRNVFSKVGLEKENCAC